MTLKVTYDIPYGNAFRQRVDLIVPLISVSGVVFWFHGGNWLEGSKSDSSYQVGSAAYNSNNENFAQSLAMGGFVVVNCNTRLVSQENEGWGGNGDGVFPNNIDDVETILRFATEDLAGIGYSEHWKTIYELVKTYGFAVAGFDTGAHLAITGAGNYGLSTNIWPKGMINMCGPMDLYTNPPFVAASSNPISAAYESQVLSRYLPVDAVTRQLASPRYRLSAWLTSLSASNTKIVNYVNTNDQLVPSTMIMPFHNALPSARKHLISFTEGPNVVGSHNLVNGLLSPLINICTAIFTNTALPTSPTDNLLVASGSLPQFDPPDLNSVEVLVVAGGGAGGQDQAGGGGGGGVIYHPKYNFLAGLSIEVIIGEGGRRPLSASSQGTGTSAQGKNSQFGSVVALGGGGGGGSASTRAAGTGGSGGGAASGVAAGAGTVGQGFAGATTVTGIGGGGGGAGGPGLTTGQGGPGLQFDISGTMTYYGGGGGGTDHANTIALGGQGGGGTNNGYQAAANNGQDGKGGGGSAYSGDWGGAGNGGSGIVIVRYPAPQRATGGAVSVISGNVIHTYSSVGKFKFITDYRNTFAETQLPPPIGPICEPIGLSEYWANDVYVRKGTVGFPRNYRTVIPEAGQIAVINFYGASAGSYTIQGKDEFGGNLSVFKQDMIIRFDVTSVKETEELYYSIEHVGVIPSGNTTTSTTTTTTTTTMSSFDPKIRPITLVEGKYTAVTLNEVTVTIIDGPAGDTFRYKIEGPPGSLTNGTGVFEGAADVLNSAGRATLPARIFKIPGDYTYTFTFGNYTGITINGFKRYHVITVTSGYELRVTTPTMVLRGRPITVFVEGYPGDLVTYTGVTSGTVQLSDPVSAFGNVTFDITQGKTLEPNFYTWDFSGNKSLGTVIRQVEVKSDAIPITATVIAGQDTVQEGGTVIFTITTTGLATNANIFFKLEPVGTSSLTAADFDTVNGKKPVTALDNHYGATYSKQLTVDRTTVDVKIATDSLVEQDEQFRLRVYATSDTSGTSIDTSSSTVTIVNTNAAVVVPVTPTVVDQPWTLTVDKTSVPVNAGLVFTLTTGNSSNDLKTFNLRNSVTGRILYPNNSDSASANYTTSLVSGRATRQVSAVASGAGTVTIGAYDTTGVVRANVVVTISTLTYNLITSGPSMNEFSTTLFEFETTDSDIGSNLYEITSNSSVVTLSPSTFGVSYYASLLKYKFLPIRVTAGEVIQGLVGYGFQTIGNNYYPNNTVHLLYQGYGQGPMYHVNRNVFPYGPVGSTSARADGSNDGLAGIGSNWLDRDPTIKGTVFQLVGMHYGDYKTELWIGVRRGQTLPNTPTKLTVYLNNNKGSAWTVHVPGRLGQGFELNNFLGVSVNSTGIVTNPDTTHPSYPATVTKTDGWLAEDSSGNYYVTGHIEIHHHRQENPIGLEQAVTSLAPHVITIEAAPADIPVGFTVKKSGTVRATGSIMVRNSDTASAQPLITSFSVNGSNFTFQWTTTGAISAIELQIVAGPGFGITYPTTVYSVSTSQNNGSFVYTNRSGLVNNAEYRMRLFITGPGGQNYTLTNAIGYAADVNFINRTPGIETIIVNPSTPSTVTTSPYAGNLEFGELDIGADIEGNAIKSRPGFKFANLAGVTRVVVKVKCDGSLTLNYDNVLVGEEVAYDSSWPNGMDGDGNIINYALPTVGQVKVITGTHSNESNISAGACRVVYRITVYTATGSWTSSSSTTPGDYARFGGTFSGG